MVRKGGLNGAPGALDRVAPADGRQGPGRPQRRHGRGHGAHGGAHRDPRIRNAWSTWITTSGDQATPERPRRRTPGGQRSTRWQAWGPCCRACSRAANSTTTATPSMGGPGARPGPCRCSCAGHRPARATAQGADGRRLADRVEVLSGIEAQASIAVRGELERRRSVVRVVAPDAGTSSLGTNENGSNAY